MKPSQIAQAVKSALTPAATQQAQPQPQPVMSPPVAAEPDAPRRNDAPLPESEFVKIDPKLNPRNIAMAEIAKRSNEQANIDAGEPMPPSIDDDVNHTPSESLEEAGNEATRLAEASEGSEPVQTQQTAPEPQKQASQAPVDDPEEVLIVDGKQMTVKRSQILDVGKRAMQKETAADFKLQVAAELLKQAQQAAGQAQPQQQPVAQQQQKPQLSDQELAQIIQFGTQEQAAQAISMLRQPQGAVTPEVLQKFVTEQLPAQMRAQMAFEEAARFAQTEYSDLLQDPYLSQAFLSEERRLRQAGDSRPHADLYKAIGEDMRVKLNRPKPGTASTVSGQAAPTNSTVTMQQRQERKANAPAAPKLASARIEGGDEVQRAPTTLETINKMRAARGQPPLSG